MATDPSTIDWYNSNTDDYTKHVRNPAESVYHSYYEKPAMVKLLPELAGKTVLSVGCGSGEDSNYLSKQGAARSVGIDISKGMIGVAQQSYPYCEFFVMDAEKLDFQDQTFDFAYSSLAMHYLEDWTVALKEVYRVLRPDSYFLFSCNHPVHSAMVTTVDDDDTKITQLARIRHKKTGLTENIGDYLTRKRLPGAPSFPVVTWHKSIGEISSEIKSAGFYIDEIVEPMPLLELEKIQRRTYEHLVRVPSFAIFKLYKASNTI